VNRISLLRLNVAGVHTSLQDSEETSLVRIQLLKYIINHQINFSFTFSWQKSIQAMVKLSGMDKAPEYRDDVQRGVPKRGRRGPTTETTNGVGLVAGAVEAIEAARKSTSPTSPRATTSMTESSNVKKKASGILSILQNQIGTAALPVDLCKHQQEHEDDNDGGGGDNDDEQRDPPADFSKLQDQHHYALNRAAQMAAEQQAEDHQQIKPTVDLVGNETSPDTQLEEEINQENHNEQYYQDSLITMEMLQTTSGQDPMIQDALKNMLCGESGAQDEAAVADNITDIESDPLESEEQNLKVEGEVNISIMESSTTPIASNTENKSNFVKDENKPTFATDSHTDSINPSEQNTATGQHLFKVRLGGNRKTRAERKKAGKAAKATAQAAMKAKKSEKELKTQEMVQEAMKIATMAAAAKEPLVTTVLPNLPQKNRASSGATRVGNANLLQDRAVADKQREIVRLAVVQKMQEQQRQIEALATAQKQIVARVNTKHTNKYKDIAEVEPQIQLTVGTSQTDEDNESFPTRTFSGTFSFSQSASGSFSYDSASGASSDGESESDSDLGSEAKERMILNPKAETLFELESNLTGSRYSASSHSALSSVASDDRSESIVSSVDEEHSSDDESSAKENDADSLVDTIVGGDTFVADEQADEELDLFSSGDDEYLSHSEVSDSEDDISGSESESGEEDDAEDIKNLQKGFFESIFLQLPYDNESPDGSPDGTSVDDEDDEEEQVRHNRKHQRSRQHRSKKKQESACIQPVPSLLNVVTDYFVGESKAQEKSLLRSSRRRHSRSHRRRDHS